MFTIVQFTLCRDTQKQSERFKMFDSLLVCSLAYVKMMICEIIKKKKLKKNGKQIRIQYTAHGKQHTHTTLTDKQPECERKSNIYYIL